jgi:hypothetical protein
MLQIKEACGGLDNRFAIEKTTRFATIDFGANNS